LADDVVLGSGSFNLQAKGRLDVESWLGLELTYHLETASPVHQAGFALTARL
jgi:hypothetical protein